MPTPEHRPDELDAIVTAWADSVADLAALFRGDAAPRPALALAPSCPAHRKLAAIFYLAACVLAVTPAVMRIAHVVVALTVAPPPLDLW